MKPLEERMLQPGRTLRVFVSSTFGDLKAERDALQQRVFPALRDLCRRHGCRFQAIDLRWGVRDEAGLDQQTMRICLEEVARCLRVSPRPNFLVLLGDRYGWRPLPAEIPADEFEHLLAEVPPADRGLLRWEEGQPNGEGGWYRRDDNAVPPAYCLQPRTGEYTDFARWAALEARLLDVLRRAAAQVDLSPAARLRYGSSATEQEIIRGALEAPDAGEHVFCFFREIDGLPRDRSAGPYLDLDPDGNPDLEAQARLRDLKTRLYDRLPGHVYAYRAAWTGEGISTDHLDQLCRDVYAALSRVIEGEINRQTLNDPLTREINAQAAFAAERTRAFVGRQAILQRLSRYTSIPAPGTDRTDQPLPLVVWGASGSGKSALLARAATHAKQEGSAVVVTRFIGTTPASADLRSLLGSLCDEIARAYGVDDTAAPEGFQALAREFASRLELATAARPLVVFLDALDQLAPEHGSHSLTWLPHRLPGHVRLVLSTLPGDCLSALRSRLPPECLLELEPLSLPEGAELLDLWLREHHRTLQPVQRERVLGGFRTSPLPLYLKLALEAAVRWKSYTPPLALAADIRGMVLQLFRRLADEHGPLLLSRSLGYLAAARHGLSEDEILDLLARDRIFFRDFLRHAHHDLPHLQTGQQELPVVVWSRLYFELEPYLTERSADGTTLLAFYHRQVGDIAAEEFLAGAAGRGRHSALARYYRDQPLWLDRPFGQPNLRKVAELPFHLTYGKRWSALKRTLCDLEFIEAKCAAGMTYDLVGDYDRLGTGGTQPSTPVRTARLHEGRYGVQCPFCQAWNEVEKETLDRVVVCAACAERVQVTPFALRCRWEPAGLWASAGAATPGFSIEELPPLLAEFATFVTSQAHALAGNPSITFQQAANQPEGTAPAEAAQQRQVTEQEVRPWLRWLRRPMRPSNTLISFDGHEDRLTACAYSPDGSRIVSAAADGTVRVWNAVTGEELLRLPDQRFMTQACRFSPDGARILTGGGNGSLKLWDAASGAEIRTLDGFRHRFVQKLGAHLRDGAPLGLMCSVMGACLGLFFGFARWGLFGEFVPMLWLALILGGIGGLIATVFHIVDGYRHDRTVPIQDCAFSPDGDRVLAVYGDGQFRLWDTRTARCVPSFRGRRMKVGHCAFSPDGTRVLSVSGDGTVRVWDAQMGRVLLTFHAPGLRCIDCQYSPDGTRVALAQVGGGIQIWDAATGQALTALGEPDANAPCAYLPDGRRMVARTCEGLAVWDTEDGRNVGRLGQQTAAANKCAVSPDGRHVVWGGGGFRFCEMRLASLDGQDGGGDNDGAGAVRGEERWLAPVFLPEGVRVATLDSGHLLLRRAETGEAIALAAASAPMRNAVFSPGGSRLATLSADNVVRLWDIPGRREIAAFTGVFAVTGFASDGQRLVLDRARAADGFLVVDAATGAETAVLPKARGSQKGAVLSPDGTRLVAWSYHNRPNLYDLTEGKTIPLSRRHDSNIWNCVFSPDGRRIVSTGDGGRRAIIIWDAATGEPLHVIACQGKAFLDGVLDCAFSPDARRFVTSTGDGRVNLWDVESGALLACLPGHTQRAWTCCFSPDGRYVAAGSDDGMVRIWSGYTGAALACLPGQRGEVRRCRFSPDGQRLLVVSDNDRNLRVWDTATYGLTAELPGLQEIERARWSPDGRFLYFQERRSDSLQVLRLENAAPSPPVVTAWWPDQRVEPPALACPLCRRWSEVPPAALGTDVACPHCGGWLRLPQFTLPGDWRALAATWEPATGD